MRTRSKLCYRGCARDLIAPAPGAENAQRIRKSFAPLLERGQLKFAEGFVTKESVTSLIDRVGGLNDLDLFSIDIDGNDFHILEALPLKAKLVITEYNSKFAPPIEWTIPYDPDHVSSAYGGVRAWLHRGNTMQETTTRQNVWRANPSHSIQPCPRSKGQLRQ